MEYLANDGEISDKEFFNLFKDLPKIRTNKQLISDIKTIPIFEQLGIRKIL